MKSRWTHYALTKLIFGKTDSLKVCLGKQIFLNENKQLNRLYPVIFKGLLDVIVKHFADESFFVLRIFVCFDVYDLICRIRFKLFSPLDKIKTKMLIKMLDNYFFQKKKKMYTQHKLIVYRFYRLQFTRIALDYIWFQSIKFTWMLNIIRFCFMWQSDWNNLLKSFFYQKNIRWK